jgi:hypothetical protein
MDPLRFTERDTRLATERRSKFQGTAKVNLEQIYFDPQTSRQLDNKNVERLCRIFREEDCQNLALENRVPAVVARHDLETALQAANISAMQLLTNEPSKLAFLQFHSRQLQGLHGRHRIEAGLAVLLRPYRVWAVDLYLDSMVHILLSVDLFNLTQLVGIGEDLKTSLVEEYSNEKRSTDGEIYRKIRQYQENGNSNQ